MFFDDLIVKNKSMPKCDIPLKWYISNNYGDACNPLLFNFLTGKQSVNVDLTYNKSASLLMIGSILNCSCENDIIWGAGISSKPYITRNFKSITCLRGPFSRRSIDKNKQYSFNDIYCDPGVLIPCMFNIKKDKSKYKVGIIPHQVDYQRIKQNFNKDNLIIDITLDPYTITKLISQCDYIISSSLHGIIVAESLQIPCAWIKLSDKIIGGKYKFLDYYAGCGINENDVICNDFTNKQFSAQDLNAIKYNKRGIHNIDQLLYSFPFKIAESALSQIKSYYEY